MHKTFSRTFAESVEHDRAADVRQLIESPPRDPRPELPGICLQTAAARAGMPVMDLWAAWTDWKGDPLPGSPLRRWGKAWRVDEAAMEALSRG